MQNVFKVFQIPIHYVRDRVHAFILLLLCWNVFQIETEAILRFEIYHVGHTIIENRDA